MRKGKVVNLGIIIAAYIIGSWLDVHLGNDTASSILHPVVAKAAGGNFILAHLGEIIDIGTLLISSIINFMAPGGNFTVFSQLIFLVGNYCYSYISGLLTQTFLSAVFPTHPSLVLILAWLFTAGASLIIGLFAG